MIVHRGQVWRRERVKRRAQQPSREGSSRIRLEKIRAARKSQEEIRKPPIPRRPCTPTAAEVDAHPPPHLVFRFWCPHCTTGKGIATQHRNSTGKVTELGVTLSLEYCFMTAEESGDDMRAILNAYDPSKSGLWALPVEQKGAQDTAVVK